LRPSFGHGRANGVSGHIWQGRFKAFPIEQNEHLLTVLRYLERNPVRANLVRRAERWPWSSARCWQGGAVRPAYLVAGPVRRPGNWLEWVNQPLTAAEMEAVRRCVNRGGPYGSAAWVARAATALGLESALRPRGRPRKEAGAGAAK
jgi:putative transposase